MKSRFLKIFFAVSIVLLFVSAAYAEVTNSYGLYFRLRQETWDNMFDMNRSDVPNASPYARQDETFWRLKTSIWDKVDIDNRFGLFVRLTNEAKYYNTSNTAWQLGTVGDEILFDNLYAYIKKPADLPVDLTIGRQDFLGTFGEMFLIADGTPLDGSRTYYFNAARALTTLNDKYNVDFVYIFTQESDGLPIASNYSKSELATMDPTIDSRQLNPYDERAFVLYGRGKITDNLTIEPYYIWKVEEAPNKNPSLPALRLNTYGLHAVYGFGDGWKAHGEYAFQSGSYDNGTDRTGNGGYAFIGRTYSNIASQPSWDLGYITLSGDDPNTTKVEAWDPLFSRYPWMSELYSLTMLTEKGPGQGIPAYWTNLQVYRAQFKFNLPADSRLELSYNVLKANETVMGFGPFVPLFSGTGRDRGTLEVVKLYHKFSSQLDGYVTVEAFQPGNVYATTNHDAAQFVRWELQWKI
jgi:hypothetical protein